MIAKTKVSNTAILKFTYDDALEILLEAANEIKSEYEKLSNHTVSIKFTEKLSTIQGYCNYNHNGNCQIVVGINNLNDAFVNKLGDKTLYIKDGNFVAALDTLFHESRHLKCKLLSYENCNKTFDEKVLLNCTSLASANYNYYNMNYLDMPFEIDAEQFGINKSYSFLYETCEIPAAEKVVLNYVNDRINLEYRHFTRERYILMMPERGKYVSLNEVDNKFGEQFTDSLKTRLVYEISSKNKDKVSRLLCKSGWEEIKKEMDETTKTVDFDMKMACLELYLHPKRIEEASFLKKIDIEPESIFKHPFPEKQNIISRIGRTLKTICNENQLDDFSDR